MLSLKHSQLGLLQGERPVAEDDKYEWDDNVEPLWPDSPSA